ncbi:MAG: endonuclease domain-containing protein [Actinomycetota bacterium]
MLHQRRDLIRTDLTRLGPIPITTVAKTLIDLSATASAGEIETALDDALRKRMTTLPRLLARVDRQAGPGRTGCALLKKLLAERSIYELAPDNGLERRFLRLMRKAGLARPRPQFIVTEGAEFIARVDFAFPQLLIAIEMDSYEYHLDPAAFQLDRTQSSRLAGMGWLVLLFTSDDLKRRPITSSRPLPMLWSSEGRGSP